MFVDVYMFSKLKNRTENIKQKVNMLQNAKLYSSINHLQIEGIDQNKLEIYQKVTE